LNPNIADFNMLLPEVDPLAFLSDVFFSDGWHHTSFTTTLQADQRLKGIQITRCGVARSSFWNFIFRSRMLLDHMPAGLNPVFPWVPIMRCVLPFPPCVASYRSHHALRLIVPTMNCATILKASSTSSKVGFVLLLLCHHRCCHRQCEGVGTTVFCMKWIGFPHCCIWRASHRRTISMHGALPPPGNQPHLATRSPAGIAAWCCSVLNPVWTAPPDTIFILSLVLAVVCV
jgi:hypothetical protein